MRCRGDRLVWLATVAVGVLQGTLSAAVVQFASTATLPPQASVVKLADVAKLRDFDSETQRKLEQVTLGPAPAAGKSMRIDFELVKSRLQLQGINLAQVEFTGSGSVTVTAPAESALEKNIPARTDSTVAATSSQQQKVHEQLLNAFQRHYQLNSPDHPGWKATLQVHEEDIPVFLAMAPRSRLDFVEPSLQPGGPQAMTVRVTKRDGTVQAVGYLAWVSPLPQVLAARYALPKGSVLQPSDLQWTTAKEKDAEDGLAVLVDVVGKETTRTLRAGESIKRSDLDDIPLIRANDIVTVRVQRPGFSCRRQFKALTPGALNDTVVLVSLEDARDRINARVTGYHEAEILGAPNQARAATPATDPAATLQASTVQFVPQVPSGALLTGTIANEPPANSPPATSGVKVVTTYRPGQPLKPLESDSRGVIPSQPMSSNSSAMNSPTAFSGVTVIQQTDASKPAYLSTRFEPMSTWPTHGPATITPASMGPATPQPSPRNTSNNRLPGGRP